jgi:hypothetical protein
MKISIDVDPSWLGYPDALAEFLCRLRALERPASRPEVKKPTTEHTVGHGNGNGATASAPAPAPGPTVQPPAEHTPGTPRTGQEFYSWCRGSNGRWQSARKLGKTRGYPDRFMSWNPDQVADVHHELTRPGGKWGG